MLSLLDQLQHFIRTFIPASTCSPVVILRKNKKVSGTIVLCLVYDRRELNGEGLDTKYSVHALQSNKAVSLQLADYTQNIYELTTENANKLCNTNLLIFNINILGILLLVNAYYTCKDRQRCTIKAVENHLWLTFRTNSLKGVGPQDSSEYYRLTGMSAVQCKPIWVY